MKKIISIIILFLLGSVCFGQSNKSNPNQDKINTTITGFLKWYKQFDADTTKKSYALLKGGYPDTASYVRIDRNGMEQYLNEIRKSRFVSETYIDGLRNYFLSIDEGLAAATTHNHDLVKIPGMDIDFVLHTFEPEAILDHIGNSKISKLFVIYNKALVTLHISKHIDLLFVLTRQKNTWIIDYLGDDATDKNSFFLQ